MPSKKKDIAATVAEATILARQIKADCERLDELKNTIRLHAEGVATKRGDDEKVEIASPEGVCTVVFPSDSRILKRGADPLRLVREGTVPQAQFDELFVTKACPLPEMWDRIKFTESSLVRSAIRELFEKRPNAPRVTLAK